MMPALSEARGNSRGRAPIPVKVIVGGGFGVGKTTFVSTVSEIEPVTTEGAMTSLGVVVDDRAAAPTKLTTTVAMDFGRVTIDPTLVVYLFGTPGQERFGFMWDDLVHGAVGAVVLVDTRRVTDSFPAIDYFEHIDLPFVVAVNRFDGVLSHEIDDIRVALGLTPDVPVIAADARVGDDVKDTLLALLDVVLARALARARVG
jgi:signal recognition particle receptor subunit beta